MKVRCFFEVPTSAGHDSVVEQDRLNTAVEKSELVWLERVADIHISFKMLKVFLAFAILVMTSSIFSSSANKTLPK